jgi:hypothetical protein
MASTNDSGNPQLDPRLAEFLEEIRRKDELIDALKTCRSLTSLERGETLTGSFGPGRAVKITMPDGEILEGTYSVASNATFSTGTAVARSGNSITTISSHVANSGGASEAYALVKSQKSRLMMEIIVTYSPTNTQGFGEARTDDGRVYKVQF